MSRRKRTQFDPRKVADLMAMDTGQVGMSVCARLLGGVIGSLVTVAGVETTREAVRWWAETDEAWAFVDDVVKASKGHGRFETALRKNIERSKEGGASGQRS